VANSGNLQVKMQEVPSSNKDSTPKNDKNAKNEKLINLNDKSSNN